MSLRPTPAQWFELVTVHKELTRVMECLSRTGAVELEARSSADRLLFRDVEEALKAQREMARRYHTYWPAPAAAAVESRASEPLSETLKTALARLAAWTDSANPLIAELEQLARETAELAQLHAALSTATDGFPDLHLLAGAGPKLQVRLLTLPAGTMLREVPALMLYKPWQTPEANYALMLGPPADIAEIEAQLPALKGQLVPLPAWLPSSPQEAVTAVAQRQTAMEKQRDELNADLAALSERLHIAEALGDVALVEWLNDHAKDLRGSERLAWVTGWTSDVEGKRLRGALEQCDVRYILRMTQAPEGLSPPLVLSNPGWARAFEVFAQMLGTPGRHESDPSQIVAVIASLIFGFMFGDIGHGAVVLIAGLALRRRYPLTGLMVPGGIVSIIFGFLFGAVFCREDVIPALWMQPLSDPITLLLAGVIAGMAIIAIGLVLDAVQMHWRGEATHWWGHRAGLVVAYVGLMIAPLWEDGLLVTAAGALWFVLGGAVVAHEGRLAALASAAAEFVEQAMRLLVNTVSFARIGAFALAHAGLSVAIIEMANASGHIGYWIVLVVGNVLVIALEGVVVSIQTTRLLLFEFFIRFLTGAGRAFKPLPPPAMSNVSEPNLGGSS
jgi:V/A-type H+/Na+-transporting ATPase subunit I